NQIPGVRVQGAGQVVVDGEPGFFGAVVERLSSESAEQIGLVRQANARQRATMTLGAVREGRWRFAARYKLFGARHGDFHRPYQVLGNGDGDSPFRLGKVQRALVAAIAVVA